MDDFKSRFIELFGDPVINPKRWDITTIEGVSENNKYAIKAGPFGSALKKEYYVQNGYKIYGQEQVISGDPNFGDYYISESKYKDLESCAVKAGDVLISLVGTYGKLLIIPKNYQKGIINPRLMKISLNTNVINSIYFKYYFTSDATICLLQRISRGGTMDILNVGLVKRVTIALPPLTLQNEFAAFVQQVDKLKFVIQQTLEKTCLSNDFIAKIVQNRHQQKAGDRHADQF